MQTPLMWRELLGKIIDDPQERQRIADELGISPFTINRWIHGTSIPREQNLRRLLSALPEHRDVLLELLAIDFPTLSFMASEEPFTETTDEIPPVFYGRALNAYTTTPSAQRFWTMSSLILQQAIEQLDPNEVGMAITIVQCMSPAEDGKVHSLRVSTGSGTPPWSASLDQHAIFLGAESLAGRVVSDCRSIVIQNRHEQGAAFAAHWLEFEESAAAYPIMRAGSIAGSLVISCRQREYLLPFRCKLMQSYAQLLSLVFEPHEFYPSERIDLRVMPFYRMQASYLSTFRQRVSAIMIDHARQKQPLTMLEAEQRAWKQLEEELIHLPMQK